MVTNRLPKMKGFMMAYINSKKYGSAVQLYKKANGDTAYSITYKDEHNKLKRIKIGDKSKGITESYCNQKRIEIINSIKLGEEPPSLARKKKKKVIKLNDIGDIYFKRKEAYVKNDIKYYYKNYPLRLREKFGDVDIDTITSEKIFEYQLELNKKGLAPATINNTIRFLGTLFNLAIDEKLYHKQNPTKSKKIKSIKVNNQRDRYLTLEEIQELYTYLDDETLKLFVDLSLSTGGRLETILNIKVRDINVADKMLTLRDLKNDSDYKGFIPDDLLEHLKECTNTLPANNFLVGGKIEKVAGRTMRRKMKNIFDPLFNEGLDSRDAKNRVVIHSLRHTFASHLAINGTPIFTIQKLMNHRDIKQTMRYAKLAPDSGKDFVNGLYK
jgi:integrase